MPGTDLAVMEKRQEERSVSWGEIDWMVEMAVANMRERGFRPSQIIPIGGGGLIPASILAYRFYKKDHIPITVLPPVWVKSYSHDHKQGRMSVVWSFDDPQMFDSTQTLLVDDIVDTGRTLWALRERMPKSPCFAIVSKLKSRGPEWFSTYDKDNLWWIFPWEKEVPNKDGPTPAV